MIEGNAVTAYNHAVSGRADLVKENKEVSAADPSGCSSGARALALGTAKGEFCNSLYFL